MNFWNAPRLWSLMEDLQETKLNSSRELERSNNSGVAQMGWEQRGNNRYYYKKERQGSTVRSVYVGRGEIADMISKLQSNSTDLEKLMRAKRLIETDKIDHVETTLDRAIELTELFTQATLLVAGFHTHHRQWRRKRKCR